MAQNGSGYIQPTLNEMASEGQGKGLTGTYGLVSSPVSSDGKSYITRGRGKIKLLRYIWIVRGIMLTTADGQEHVISYPFFEWYI